MDASAVFHNAVTIWNNYYSLQDFMVSYFAFRILGHPGAVAAILNDSQLRSSVTSAFPNSLNEIAVMESAKLKSIAKQMFGQDMYRFNKDDKDTWNPLKFYSGDSIMIRIIIQDNLFSLYAPGMSTSFMGGNLSSQNQSISNSSIQNGNYLLNFILA